MQEIKQYSKEHGKSEKQSSLRKSGKVLTSSVLARKSAPKCSRSSFNKGMPVRNYLVLVNWQQIQTTRQKEMNFVVGFRSRRDRRSEDGEATEDGDASYSPVLADSRRA